MKLPFYVFALLVLLAFSAFSCEELESCEEEFEECEDVFRADVVAKDVLCGVGVWSAIWFEDDSNSTKDTKHYLQPYSLTKKLATQLAKENFAIEPNAKYRISYKLTTPDGRYDDLAVCEVYVGEKIPIQLCSIKYLSENEQ